MIVSHLGNPLVTREVLNAINIGADSSESMGEKLIELGQKSAADFLKHFQDERKKTFKSTFRVDFSIDQDDRYELDAADQLLKHQLKEVREHKRSKDDVTKKFDELIAKHVAQDLELASESLKNGLGYDADIYDTNDDENDA